MRSAIHNVTFDCRDPYALATFWSQVFDRPLHDDDHPGDPEAVVLLGDGLPNLLFQVVPEPKQTKNRVHLDLQPDHPRDDEVDRLLGPRRHLGRGPPETRRDRVGDPRRPRGQRVLRRAQRRGTPRHGRLTGLGGQPDHRELLGGQLGGRRCRSARRCPARTPPRS